MLALKHSISGQNLAWFYTIMLWKWVKLRFCVFLWHFMHILELYVTFSYFFATFGSFGPFTLFCRKLDSSWFTHFFLIKCFWLKPCLCKKNCLFTCLSSAAGSQQRRKQLTENHLPEHVYKASLTKESKVEAKKSFPDPKVEDATPKSYPHKYGNDSDQVTSTKLARIGISLDGLFCDRSTTESSAGAAKGETTPVTNNQRAKDDLETEFKTTSGDTIKNVLYNFFLDLFNHQFSFYGIRYSNCYNRRWNRRSWT